MSTYGAAVAKLLHMFFILITVKQPHNFISFIVRRNFDVVVLKVTSNRIKHSLAYTHSGEALKLPQQSYPGAYRGDPTLIRNMETAILELSHFHLLTRALP